MLGGLAVGPQPQDSTVTVGFFRLIASGSVRVIQNFAFDIRDIISPLSRLASIVLTNKAITLDESYDFTISAREQLFSQSHFKLKTNKYFFSRVCNVHIIW